MPMVVKSTSGEFLFTIADGASLSNAVDLKGAIARYLIVPAGVEGTHVVFYRVYDGVDYSCVDDTDNTIVSVPITAGKSIELDPVLLGGAGAIRIRTASTSGGTAQVQTGAATLVLGVMG